MIYNESFALREPMKDENLVRKVLISLPDQFLMKVSAIKEVHDVKNMRLDELMGSLIIFQMHLNENEVEERNRSVGLKESENDHDMSTQIAYLTKDFGKFMKKQHSSQNVQNIRGNNFQKRNKFGFNGQDNRYVVNGCDDDSATSKKIMRLIIIVLSILLQPWKEKRKLFLAQTRSWLNFFLMLRVMMTKLMLPRQILNQKFAKHLPDGWSNDEEVNVIEENIIENYSCCMISGSLLLATMIQATKLFKIKSITTENIKLLNQNHYLFTIKQQEGCK